MFKIVSKLGEGSKYVRFALLERIALGSSPPLDGFLCTKFRLSVQTKGAAIPLQPVSCDLGPFSIPVKVIFLKHKSKIGTPYLLSLRWSIAA